MSKISVVINTRNEEKHLAKCLESVKGFADEIVVVDMHSIDKSVEIAQKYGAKVYDYKPLDYVEPARNFGLQKATSEYILLLDPDEVVPKTLQKRLLEIVETNEADYVRIPRKNMVFGKWIEHSRWWPDYLIRFFKKGKVVWDDEIHSIPVTSGKGIDLPAKEEFAIEHHNYESIEEYIVRMNRYTTVQAKGKIDDGYKFQWHDLITKPSNEFLSRYFQGEGYKDGLHGLLLASLQSSSELVLYAKIWQLSGFKEKKLDVTEVIQTMKQAESDMHYWEADTLLKEVGGLKHRIKRKFRLS